MTFFFLGYVVDCFDFVYLLICLLMKFEYMMCFLCRANDICKESNRQIINAEDVFKALEEIDFAEFVQPLRASLEGLYLFDSMLLSNYVFGSNFLFRVFKLCC